MLRNYFKMAVRTQMRSKGTTFINIVGLSLGLVSFILIGLYVQAEQSYDSASAFSPDIYRVHTNEWAFAPLEWKTQFAGGYPEIHDVLRLTIPGNNKILVQHGDIRHYEEHRFSADPQVFPFFGITLAHGNPETALSEPGRVVLSQAMADKYFAGQDPMGQTLTIDNATDYEVVGVLGDLPNMHLTLDFLFSHDTTELQGWGWTYLHLQAGADIAALTEKISAKEKELHTDFPLEYHLFPLEDIHLHSHLLWEIEANGNALYVRLFGFAAVLILLIACINFMNVATARSIGRAKEVGMRKVLGARRGQLIGQYLAESVLMVGLAVIVAMGILVVAIPPFEAFAGTKLTFLMLAPHVWVQMVVLIVGVGVLSGLYPAFYLSSFQPARVLKSKAASSRGVRWLRQGLVVFQFSISIFLLAGTGLINHQLDFLKNQDLGYGNDQVLVIPIRGDQIRARVPTIKEQLKQHSNVLSVAATTNIPGQYGFMPNQPLWGEGLPENETIQMPEFVADEDFLETMGLELVAGRNFSAERGTDGGQAFILNESAVKAFGWDDPIGKKVRSQMQEGEVVGVVRDFHLKSLHESIGPLGIEFHDRNEENWWERVLAVRIRAANVGETLAFLQTSWTAIDPSHPFEYAFMDEAFNEQYRAEETLETVFYVFSVLGMLIACLGLFGLAMYAAEQRTKEMGIRKILGASISGLVGTMTWDMVRLVLVALVVSTPLIYIAMSTWLQGFAYRTSIPVVLFVGAGGAAALIAFLTVGYQALKAALANPVEVLRSE